MLNILHIPQRTTLNKIKKFTGEYVDFTEIIKYDSGILPYTLLRRMIEI
jgi:hypothetical protein